MVLLGLSAASDSPSCVIYVMSKPVEFLDLCGQDRRPLHNTNSKPSVVRTFSCHVMKKKDLGEILQPVFCCKGIQMGSQRFGKICKCSSCCDEPAGVWAGQQVVQSFGGGIYTVKLHRLVGLISYLQTNCNCCQDSRFSRGGKEPFSNAMSGLWHSEAALVHVTRQ